MEMDMRCWEEVKRRERNHWAFSSASHYSKALDAFDPCNNLSDIVSTIARILPPRTSRFIQYLGDGGQHCHPYSTGKETNS